MSLETAISRMSQLQQMLNPQLAIPTSSTSSATSVSGAGGSQSSGFNSALTTAMAGTSSVGAVSGNTAGARMVALAQREVGQAEQPPGSNNSPRIAQYRTATEGSMSGQPWCGYFVSWLA